jgi:hypothetical protein
LVTDIPIRDIMFVVRIVPVIGGSRLRPFGYGDVTGCVSEIRQTVVSSGVIVA